MLRQRLAIKTSPMGKSHGACFFAIGGVLFWAQCLGSRTALPRQAGPMQKGKESMAVRPPDPRPFSRPRRGPCRCQVDSTGPCAIIQRSRLYLPRQRWLPCAKGAVGERRLRDWRRDAAPILRSRAKPVVSIQAKRVLPAAARRSPPLCKGGTAWQGHAGGIVRPIASNRPFLRFAARIAGQLFPALARQRRSTRGSKAYSLGEFWPSGHRTHAGKNRSTS